MNRYKYNINFKINPVLPCFSHWHSYCNYSCEYENHKQKTGVLKWQDIQEVTDGAIEVQDTEAVAQVMGEDHPFGAVGLAQDGVPVFAPEREMDIHNTIPGTAGSLPTGA